MSVIQDIRQGDIETAVTSGIRNSQAHHRYSTEKVKLAFGRHRQGRIRHVGSVENGKACDCTCPACSEPLVSKQGEIKAWHFAHASGHSCQEALSASFAAYLAQCLTEMDGILLPAIDTQWGQQTTRVREARIIQLPTARASQPEPGRPFEVDASVVAGDGVEHHIKFRLRTVRRANFGLLDRDPGKAVSTVEIDLFTPLGDLFSEGHDFTLDEAWVRDQLLIKAPRTWLRNLHLEDLHTKKIATRLGPFIRAAESAAELRHDMPPRVEVQKVEALGLSDLLSTAEIQGETFFGYGSASWRAALVWSMIVKPVIQSGQVFDLRSIGIDRRRTYNAIRSTGLVANRILTELPSGDDWIELTRILPDLRPSISIVEDYLSQLWQAGHLAAKPTFRNKRSALGPLDYALAPRDMPWWRPSNDLIRRINHARERVILR